MHDLIPPREILPWLLIIVAIGIAVAYIIGSIGPQEPQKPWRWGDTPRRPNKKEGLAGFITGFAMFLCMLLLARQ
jgi:hypothetical protein